MSKETTQIILTIEKDAIVDVSVSGEKVKEYPMTGECVPVAHKVDSVLVFYKPNKSPCCIIINNREYCWC
jgi:hypothetical protein